MKMILILLIVWIIIYLLNETTFLYKEPIKYNLPNYSNLISPLASPIFHTNSNSNAVIIFYHGYKATPQEFRDIAYTFVKEYNVVVPLYPGHGVSEENFKKTYFSQWYTYAKDIYLDNRRKYKKVYICGLSMGGLISLRLAEEFSFDANLAPDGVISISTPVFLNNLLKNGIFYDWRLYFTRFISWFIDELKETIKEVDDDGANWIGYEGKIFPKQVHSLKMGMLITRKNLSKITVPILLMHSKGDKTAPFKNLFYIANHISSAFIKIRTFDLRKYQHTRHLLTLYNSTKEEVTYEIRCFLNQLNQLKTK